MVVLAPIETLLPIDTFPKCAIGFHFLFLSRAFPKPSEPITTPGEMMQLFPMMLPRWIVTLDSI